tara:strand:+ start:1270 stop:4497 length:3228 start_codon:yes stop_codon:yes gene_type:complete
MRTPKVAILLIFLLISSHLPLSSADEVHATSYSDSIDSQSTWSEVKVLPNAFDSNNATSTFIEANRCDGGSATCTSGQTYIVLDIEIQMSSNTTRADVRWKMEAPDGSTPTDSKGTISIFDYSNSNWVLQAQDTLISTSVRVQEIPVLNSYQDTSNKITLRFALYHNGTSFVSDELAMYVYTIYDVREDITDSDGDGIDDVADSCPNGETGWTSTPTTDHDGDGCRDSTEDNDNDNDLILNLNDDCPKGELSWLSDSISDYDGDGCKDDHTEDDDDDNDGYNDTREAECESNPKNELSLPTLDLDGDTLCDAEDPDIDGDGLANDVESNTSLYVDEFNTGTSNMSADSDGDSYCDGPSIPLLPTNACLNPSDAFPNDAAAYRDTDDDGMPDELIGTSITGLVEDLDDDNDNWNDLDEASCGGTDPKDDSSFPVDGDTDGVCDLLDFKSLWFEIDNLEQTLFEGVENQNDFNIVANLSGMLATSWEIEPDLPDEFTFIEGNISASNPSLLVTTQYTIWANNSLTGISLEKIIQLSILVDWDTDGLPDGPTLTNLISDDDDDDDGLNDELDNCSRGTVGWISNNSTDYDSDGCADANEDLDDDNDLVLDDDDLCPFGIIGLTVQDDADRDGCKDEFEPINIGLNSVFSSITGFESENRTWELDSNSTLPDFFSIYVEGNETYLQSNSTTETQELYELTFVVSGQDENETNMTLVLYGNLTIVYSPTINIYNPVQNTIITYENNTKTENIINTTIIENNIDDDDESVKNILMVTSSVIIFLLLSLLIILFFRKRSKDSPRNVTHITQINQTSLQTIDQSQHQALTQTQNIDQKQYLTQSIVGDGNVQISSEGDTKATIDQSRNELVINILPQQYNLNEHFSLWCLERLKMKGERKMGDDSHLIIPQKFTNWISELEANSIMEIKISIALNYPDYWTKEYESNARVEIDKFLNALASLGGKFDVGTGFFVHGGDSERKDVQVEYSGTFVSGRSPKDLASYLGLIRTAIWEYCSNLKQRSVFVQIGTTIADCVNPLPIEAEAKTEEWLDDLGGTHIDLPKESFENSIEPQRDIIQADLSF